jgi:hypothetical protein
MAIHKLLITDITAFGDLYCVAGWDQERQSMIRPEPPDTNANSLATRFWNNNYVGPDKVFWVGHVVQFEATTAPKTFPYPHATEDVIVRPSTMIQQLERLTLEQTAAYAAGSVSETIEQAYDGGLAKTNSGLAFVPRGYKGRSLGALQTDHTSFEFWEKTYPGKAPKLRVLTELNGQQYDLPVTDFAAHTIWRGQGLVALQERADAASGSHTRLGLSRPFAAQPDACFVQVNGLYFFS